MIEHLGPQLFNGIVLGAFYAIVALGLSLIMNLTGTINMAHGSFMTLAGYLAYSMVLRNVPFGWALILAPLFAVFVGVIVERTLVRPLYKREPFYSLLMTFGLSLIAEEVFRLIWGPNGVPFSPPASLGGTLNVGFMPFPTFRIFIVLVLVIAIAALALFLTRTRFGLRLRAAVTGASSGTTRATKRSARTTRSRTSSSPTRSSAPAANHPPRATRSGTSRSTASRRR